jgi:raffinose/stachyose/melibiose transport system permease protein
VLPTVAVAQLFVKVYEIVPQYGLLNSILDLIGLGKFVQPWLGQPSTALLALCAQDIWRAIGFYAIIFYAGLISISPEIIDAARIDGASTSVMIRRIMLPLLTPVIATGLVYCLTGTLKAFETIYALTGGGPGYETMVTTIYMFKSAFTYSDYGYGSAIAVFILAECLVITLVTQRLLSRTDVN